MPDLTDLIARVEALNHTDNAIDVEVEIALFEPSTGWASCRPNSAGTKVIYTHSYGGNSTVWADDWTLNRERRAETVRLLKERAAVLRAREAGRG